MSEQDPSGHREQLEEFIQCYRSETCVWKTKSKDYHDRNKKNAAYNRLVGKYKTIDPNANREIVVKKINNLRTAYKKELHKMKQSNKSGAGTEEIYTPHLWYFDLLTFLYDQEVPIPSISNINEDENEEQFSETSQQSVNIDSQSQSPQQYNTWGTDQETPSRSGGERDTPTSSRLDSERDTPTPKRRSRPMKDTNEAVLKNVNEHFKRPRIPENRFEVYGRSVGMKLQELPTDHRIVAEKIINEALFLAELGRLTTSHSVTVPTQSNIQTLFGQPHVQTFSTRPQLSFPNFSYQPHAQSFSTQSQSPFQSLSNHSHQSQYTNDENDDTAASYLSLSDK